MEKQISSRKKAVRRIASKDRYQMMSNDFAQPYCHACGFSYPPIVHGHHIKPVAATNGVSVKTVWLCPNCHAMVHEIIRCYYSARRPSHYETRMGHLDYWLSEICGDKLRKTLIGLAKESV